MCHDTYIRKKYPAQDGFNRSTRQRLEGSPVVTHTHMIPPWEDQCEWHRMTRMTRPDCAVMCNLINTHTHTHSLIPPREDQCKWHRMTRMTGPDCVVMCNLINTHTHTHTHTHTTVSTGRHVSNLKDRHWKERKHTPNRLLLRRVRLGISGSWGRVRFMWQEPPPDFLATPEEFLAATGRGILACPRGIFFESPRRFFRSSKLGLVCFFS